MSPKAKNFNVGSIIYFEADKADSVFLLKQGKVSLIYDDAATREKIVDQISTGEFFGVKSGLIRLPREETAKAVANSIIFEFSATEFEALIMKNTSIILKMLKVFSTQLRKVGKQIQSIVSEKVASEQADEFFQIGEYYLKNKKYKQAITVYQRYLNYYPDGKFADLASKRLSTAKNALSSYGEGGGPAPMLDKADGGGDEESSSSDMSDTGTDDFSSDDMGSTIDTSEYEADESDDGDDNDDADDFGDDFEDDLESSSEEGIELDDASSEEGKIYYKGISFMSQKKYLDAFNTFKKILGMENEQIKMLASFELGKCFFFLEKYNECIDHLTKFITKHPSFREKTEALYYLGSAYSKIKDKAKASKIFTNIITTTDESNPLNRKANKALKELK